MRMCICNRSSSCICICGCSCSCSCLSIYLSSCKLENEALLWYTSSIFELDNIKNAAILRGFLKFWTWQHQKRSNSAIRPIFEVDNIKNEAILRDFLQKCKVECRTGGLVPMRFAIFPFHRSKVLPLPRKGDARSYEVLLLSRKIILANLKICCSKMQPLSGNLHSDLPTSLVNIWNASLQILFKYPAPAKAFETATKPSPFAHLWPGAESLAPATQNDPNPSVSYTFDFEMCFAPQRRTLFGLLNFKSVPNMKCFVQFDLEMCFAPQLNFQFNFNFEMCFAPHRRALFWHLNFQKCSENGVLYILTSTCASHHNGVQCFISHPHPPL